MERNKKMCDLNLALDGLSPDEPVVFFIDEYEDAEYEDDDENDDNIGEIYYSEEEYERDRRRK